MADRGDAAEPNRRPAITVTGRRPLTGLHPVLPTHTPKGNGVSHIEGSYPPSRYDGDDGEQSASCRPADHEPEIINPAGTRVHYLAIGASTNGEFGLYRWDMDATPSGPQPHSHRTISEPFYILSGTARWPNLARSHHR